MDETKSDLNEAGKPGGTEPATPKSLRGEQRLAAAISCSRRRQSRS